MISTEQTSTATANVIPFQKHHDLIERVHQLVLDASARELPAIVGALEHLRALAWARLSTPTPAAAAAAEDRFITPEDAARIAGLPDPDGRGRRRIYEWSTGKRWASRPSRKTLRISEEGFRRWLLNRAA